MRCFTDCIVFAHAAHRRGLILDDLVAAACQAVGVKRLTQVAPHMSPAALADLVPAWLPAVPLDPFNNRPLVYRVTANSFLLYSVGSDGRDDGGAPLKRGKMGKGDSLPTTH